MVSGAAKDIHVAKQCELALEGSPVAKAV